MNFVHTLCYNLEYELLDSEKDFVFKDKISNKLCIVGHAKFFTKSPTSVILVLGH